MVIPTIESELAWALIQLDETRRELTAAREELQDSQKETLMAKAYKNTLKTTNSHLKSKLTAVTDQRDRLEIALNHSMGVITSLGEVEPDIYNLLLDARDKRTGEEYQLSVVDVLEKATEALQSLTNPEPNEL